MAKKPNLERIRSILEGETVQAVRISETEKTKDGRTETFPVIQIETTKHTVILTLESHGYLTLKSYLF